MTAASLASASVSVEASSIDGATNRMTDQNVTRRRRRLNTGT
jgi:hypothetical protein